MRCGTGLTIEFRVLAAVLALGGSLAAVCPAAAPPPAPDPARRITQYVHDVWQTEDGLPANDVQAILHAGDGYLWLATRGGLVRFDGVRFKVWNMVSTPVLGSDDLGALAAGPDGSLWVASRGAGLYRYRDGELTAFPGPGPAGSDLRALLVDGDGTLWAGSLGGLLRLSDGSLEAVEVPAPWAGAEVRALHQDADGTLWIGTYGRGLFRRRGGRFAAPDASPPAGGPGGRLTAELSSSSVNAVVRGRDGALWIGTAAGLYRLEVGRLAVYRSPDGLGDDNVQTLHEDAAGSLWIGTNSGLVRLRDGRFEGFVVRSGVAADLVRAVAVDREGSLWAGTYGSGLHRFKAGPVTAVSEREGLSHDGVWSLYGPPSGGLLVGFGDGGIDRFEDGVAAPLPLGPAFPEGAVYALYLDRRGVLWAGTEAGLVRRDDGLGAPALRLYTTADGLPGDRVRVIVAGRPDPARGSPPAEPALWLGTSGGVATLKDGVAARHPAPGLPRGDVRALLVDRGGALWAGFESGLARLAGGEVTVFTTADGLGANAVQALYEDAEGSLWIGTRGGGLARRRGGEIVAYTTRQGLPHNDAWAILEDGEGHLWWSSDQGLTRAEKTDFEAYDRGLLAAVPARSYGLADGMKVAECNGVGHPSAWKADDGRLYFASMGGVVGVDPRTRSAAVPRADVESLVAGGAAIDLGAAVELAPDQRNLEIVYTSPQLYDPARVRFRYRLVPYDRDWVDAGSRRTAFYTNLSPGVYRFRVSAGSDHGAWSDEAATVAFTLAPRFTETWGFYGACALALAVVVYQGYRLRTQSIRARNRRLLEEIAERQKAERERERLIRELEAKNDELQRFTYTVSHDLKAPLVTIKGFLGFLKLDIQAEDCARVGRDVARIEAAAGKMHVLLDDLLALSRVGRQTGVPERLRMCELVVEALELVDGEIQERGVEVEVETELPVVVGDRARLLEVLQNLLQNAVKYMGDEASPRIEVGCRREDGTAVFYVRDNGIGIEPQYHQTVFELFQRLDADSRGTGVGLALVKRIVEVHGGRVWVESVPAKGGQPREGRGKGSTFCFTLPAAEAPHR